jgi:hypothetical protein
VGETTKHVFQRVLYKMLLFSNFNHYALPGIAEVLDPKGLRKGMNKTRHTKGLSHSGGNDKTHIERASRLMTNWQNFIYLSKLYTKEEET